MRDLRFTAHARIQRADPNPPRPRRSLTGDFAVYYRCAAARAHGGHERPGPALAGRGPGCPVVTA